MAKAIMVQGTMSNVGKSLVTAGLCRIFMQDGFRTAPFKSQNMALNSYITKEGLEMGRAQVMQAEAAGLEPSVRMNPILLKPTDDTGSQVIVNGRVHGTMPAREYFSFKKQLVPVIEEAYGSLQKQFDIIVIEGAGSPAEINLKQDDIVNMGMAKIAKAPVLLVGDIDRGGVFAQLAGTILLLTEEEKRMVKGLVINKFRGDKSILDPGVEMIGNITGIPVAGVVPYMQVDLEEEDSLAERLSLREGCADPNRQVDIAVVKLPRISNFTDFAVLEGMEQVSLRYVSKVSHLKQPDMIILPGTKNTMGDLKWLRQSGMEAAILKAAGEGCVIFGICGGYQMLGEGLSDPDKAEEGGALQGMGLLPLHTCFTTHKVRTRVTGKLGRLPGVLEPLSGMELEGYEIHMGQTEWKSYKNRDRNGRHRSQERVGTVAFASLQVEAAGTGQGIAGQKADGCCAGNVYGTYVHGIFDQDKIAGALAGALAAKKGIVLGEAPAISRAAYKETQYNRLADTLRSYLDMEKIYQILEEGI